MTPPYSARIFWGPGQGDPKHIIWATLLPDGHQFAGTRWQRFLIRLLGNSLIRRWKKDLYFIAHYKPPTGTNL